MAELAEDMAERGSHPQLFRFILKAASEYPSAGASSS